MSNDSPCYKVRHDHFNPVEVLRLELSPSCFHLLSYYHMDAAKFESAKDRDSITISFLNREVKIAGRNLRQLALSLQDRDVEFIRLAPTRYSGVAGSEAGFVEAIEIK
ncbi:MAG TPA: hypothetical protein VN873_19755 [Candidatus Angelobacter sp.]|nr:hypothetical protein [Candidatus Angelobacter sp.]